MPKQNRRGLIRGEAGIKRGEEALQQQKAAQEQRAKQRNNPFRFRLDVGEEDHAAIILDDNLEDLVFRWEHEMFNEATRRYEHTGCVAETDNCPLCEVDEKPSYYAMYLTVLDLKPFTRKDGTVVPYSRKLMVVKPQQQKIFARMAQRKGSLRGMKILCSRDARTSARIGNSIEVQGRVNLTKVQAKYTRTWKDREGNEHTEDCTVPFEYEDFLELPTDEDLDAIRKRYGLQPVPGSAADTASTDAFEDEDLETEDLDDEEWTDDEAEAVDESEPPFDIDDEDEDEDEDEVAPPPPPARAQTRRRRAAVVGR